ncbi:MAG: type II toxin-antitoxin system RelE/ParE family toxin [Sulfurimonas sp.]|nr:type II toxin-antitoxin system RelE/ParE family toxin [Sulfurimonas sp.]
MKIIYQPKFINSFNQIWDYISLDSRNRANQFKKEVKEKIEDLENMPFKFRQSIYFQDENIRDLIFKGYTIVYRVDAIKEIITIIGIKKCQDDL